MVNKSTSINRLEIGKTKSLSTTKVDQIKPITSKTNQECLYNKEQFSYFEFLNYWQVVKNINNMTNEITEINKNTISLENIDTELKDTNISDEKKIKLNQDLDDLVREINNSFQNNVININLITNKKISIRKKDIKKIKNTPFFIYSENFNKYIDTHPLKDISTKLGKYIKNLKDLRDLESLKSNLKYLKREIDIYPLENFLNDPDMVHELENFCSLLNEIKGNFSTFLQSLIALIYTDNYINISPFIKTSFNMTRPASIFRDEIVNSFFYTIFNFTLFNKDKNLIRKFLRFFEDITNFLMSDQEKIEKFLSLINKLHSDKQLEGLFKCIDVLLIIPEKIFIFDKLMNSLNRYVIEDKDEIFTEISAIIERLDISLILDVLNYINQLKVPNSTIISLLRQIRILFNTNVNPDIIKNFMDVSVNIKSNILMEKFIQTFVFIRKSKINITQNFLNKVKIIILKNKEYLLDSFLIALNQISLEEIEQIENLFETIIGEEESIISEISDYDETKDIRLLKRDTELLIKSTKQIAKTTINRLKEKLNKNINLLHKYNKQVKVDLK